MITPSPQRDAIWQELHARPYVRFGHPAHVWRLSFLSADLDEATDRIQREQLRTTFNLETTYDTPRHTIAAAVVPGLGQLVFSWERHSAFVAYTLFLYDLEVPFCAFASYDQINSALAFTCAPLTATRLEIAAAADLPTRREDLELMFEGHTVNGSQVMGGNAVAWSAFLIHSGGWGRIALVVNEPMLPSDLGRTVERLLAIEDFYHLALIPLPLVRAIRSELAAAEERMGSEAGAVQLAASIEQQRAVLTSLLAIAVEVEKLRTRIAEPVAVATAYYALLERRIEELREAKVEHVLRLSAYLMRRLAPAALTYRTTLSRLADLSARVARTAELLRTSIELHVEEQNQKLLATGDQRARLQHRLQMAFESLSVVAISYYAIGILAHALEGAKHLGLPIDPDVVVAVAVPFVLLASVGFVYVIRRKYDDGHHED